MSSVTEKIIELFNSRISTITNAIVIQQETIEKLQMYEQSWSKIVFIEEEKDSILIEEKLLVEYYLTDSQKFPRQNSIFQLFIDGIIQINDFIEKGDYFLSIDEDGFLLITFYENIQPGSTISIFAIKA
jgi:hypothetical protein